MKSDIKNGNAVRVILRLERSFDSVDMDELSPWKVQILPGAGLSPAGDADVPSAGKCRAAGKRGQEQESNSNGEVDSFNPVTL